MLLSFDLATQTGWCAGSGERTPELGSFRMPETGDDVGAFLSFFNRRVGLLFEDVQPTMVVFEAPLLPKARIDERGHLKQAPTTISTTRKLQGLAGVLEMVCHDRKIECREVHLQTVKKELAGSGQAEKADMMAAAKRCGLEPANFDEADAFGVWIVAVRHYARQFQGLWDQRLYGRRAGGLV